ncbi:MAG: hypothetical protein ABI759_17755 [Candidatus Solibacter sp.]
MLSLVLTIAASAADVTGTWSGNLKVSGPDGQVQEDSVHLVLKQDGTKLTGTAGPSAAEQMPIDKGAVNGNKVTFEVALGADAAFKFAIALEGEQLRGDVTMVMGPQTVKAVMEATRGK